MNYLGVWEQMINYDRFNSTSLNWVVQRLKLILDDGNCDWELPFAAINKKQITVLDEQYASW